MLAHRDTNPTTTAPPCPSWCTEPHPAGAPVPDCYGTPLDATLPGASRPFLTARLWRCSITGRSSVEVYSTSEATDCGSADLTPDGARELAATMAAFQYGLRRLADQLTAWQHTEEVA